ncbi:MAG: SDR family oxidoreductase [Pseudomonadota bacterium]
MAGQELSGQVAIVTGGTRGLGLACANKLVNAGAQVVITGMDQARGEAAAKSIGPSAHFVRQDVSKSNEWPAVMSTAAELGPLSTMVANAGTSNFVPLESMDLKTFRALMEINLKGAFLSLKHAVAAMRDHGQGGSIIMMSSVMGRMSAPANVHYSGSKAGIRLMMKAAALELGAEKIRVNAILPGITHSDMTAGFDEDETAPTLIPMKRFGFADEIGDAVLFAASDRSRFMTGSELIVDGGLVAR